MPLNVYSRRGFCSAVYASWGIAFVIRNVANPVPPSQLSHSISASLSEVDKAGGAGELERLPGI
jgi:hypothetical protein